MINCTYKFRPTVYMEVTPDGEGRSFDSRSIKRYSYRPVRRSLSYDNSNRSIIWVNTVVYVKDVIPLSIVEPTLF